MRAPAPPPPPPPPLPPSFKLSALRGRRKKKKGVFKASELYYRRADSRGSFFHCWLRPPSPAFFFSRRAGTHTLARSLISSTLMWVYDMFAKRKPKRMSEEGNVRVASSLALSSWHSPTVCPLCFGALGIFDMGTYRSQSPILVVRSSLSSRWTRQSFVHPRDGTSPNRVPCITSLALHRV